MSIESTETPLIDLVDVSRTFDDQGRSGVTGVRLTVWRGEFVAIVGPSGAGKSTLLNLIGLLDKPSEGIYLFDGVNTTALKEKQRDRIRGRDIGFVFQSSFVLGDETSLINAALGLRINGVRFSTRGRLAENALSLLGIGQSAATEARLLSGGERQRLALARAIATKPGLVLADEPTGNLDSANTEIVVKHLKELNATGTTIVLITHDRDIAAIADRIITIVDGTVYQGVVDVVRAQTRHPAGGESARQLSQSSLFSKALDDVSDAVSAVSRRLTRSGLLVLAFALGIAGLVMSVSLTESAADQVSQRLSAAALDEVRITVPGGNTLLTDDNPRLGAWMSQLRQLPHVQSVGFIATVGANSAEVRRLRPDDPQPDGVYYVMTASTSYLREAGIDVKSSPGLRLLDGDTQGSVWVGDTAMEELSIASPGPGSSVWIGGRRVNVVGDLPGSVNLPPLDRTLVVSRDVVEIIPGASVVLVVKTDLGFPAAIAEAAPIAMSPDNPGQFTVGTVADLRALRFGVANDLAAFVSALAAILLILATFSASTTMYLSVQSRTPEIALRRAIGASRAGVGRLFLIEGTMIGLLGGALGGFAGTVAAVVVVSDQGWDPLIPAFLSYLAPILGVVTGLISAVVPAISAARKNPASALRGG